MKRRATLLLWLALASCRQVEGWTAEPKTDLALLTSLPIAFAETLTLDAPAHPLLASLEQRFAVRPVDGPEQLRASGLLLAIQPQALTAERLVALDRWVKEGGRLVLLADPNLRWESSRPLGDMFRPPVAFPDTGLLAHWGLSLDAPEAAAVSRLFDLGDNLSVTSASMGRLMRKGETCLVAPGRAIARCAIGKGRVVVVADADFAMSADPAQRAVVIGLVEQLTR